MSGGAADTPIGQAEAAALFAPLLYGLPDRATIVVAVSGGPDSTALLWLMARWRGALEAPPALIAATVDHGLRPESADEARAVARLAAQLAVEHRTLLWAGRKPEAGIQEAARAARYQALAALAREAGAQAVVTAHTLDDQAETVLLRLLRGSGPAGLAGMTASGVLPPATAPLILLVRPLLGVSKSRLIATLEAADIAYTVDPSNVDPRFTRARLRSLMPALAREGLTAQRLARLARRIGRAEEAVFEAVQDAAARLAPGPWPPRGPVTLDAAAFGRLPQEIGLRLLGWLIDAVGNEGPVELGKLEALFDAAGPALNASRHGLLESARFRQTLAGAMVTVSGPRLIVERAPSRRTGADRQPRER